MSATFVKIPGTVKFFNTERGFGFIKTDKGDAFIHISVAGDMSDKLVPGAPAIIDYMTRYVDGKYKLEVTSLISVESPPAKPEPMSVLDTVIWFDPAKGYGFINCGGAGLSKNQAHLHVSVTEKAGVIPGPDMPVRAVIIESKPGPKVLSFEWGEEVEQAYKDQLAELHAEDGAIDEAKAEKPKRRRRAPTKKPAAKTAEPKVKEVADTPADLAAEVTACASKLKGSCGPMAEAMTRAVEVQMAK